MDSIANRIFLGLSRVALDAGFLSGPLMAPSGDFGDLAKKDEDDAGIRSFYARLKRRLLFGYMEIDEDETSMSGAGIKRNAIGGLPQTAASAPRPIIQRPGIIRGGAGTSIGTDRSPVFDVDSVKIASIQRSAGTSTGCQAIPRLRREGADQEFATAAANSADCSITSSLSSASCAGAILSRSPCSASNSRFPAA
jgi:hypothetical protein